MLNKNVVKYLLQLIQNENQVSNILDILKLLAGG